MPQHKVTEQLEEEAKKSLLSYSFYRPESAIVLAMTIVTIGLSAIIPQFPLDWWFWLLFGLAGEGLIIATTLKDKRFYQKVLTDMFKQQFDLSKLRSPELRQKLNKALQYHALIIKEIEREDDPVLDDYLLNMAHGIEDWIGELYHLAKGVDAYTNDPMIKRDLQTIPQELEKYRNLLASKKAKGIKTDVEKTIAAKEKQLQTLQNIHNTIARAELQIENTISAIGTVYSQVVLLGAKDVDSGRAQRLQAEMSEQIHAIEDVSQAMDEIYQMSMDD